MKVVPGNAQHIGTRAEQQDDFGFSRLDHRDFIAHGGVLAAVTDGMGGMAMGQEASRVAKEALLRAYMAKQPQESIPRALERALRAANEAVLALAQQAGATVGALGTTLVAAVVKDHELYWVSVGDSRLYLFRRGSLTPLTEDHDYGKKLEKLVAAGKMGSEEAQSHPQRRALTSYLGLPQLTDVDHNLRPLALAEGDRVLLCSDGLYRTLSEEEVAAVLPREPQAAATALVEQILDKGRPRQDNVTVAILACDPDRLRFRWFWASPRLLISIALIGLLGLASWIYFTKERPPLPSPASSEYLSYHQGYPPLEEQAHPESPPGSYPLLKGTKGKSPAEPNYYYPLREDELFPLPPPLRLYELESPLEPMQKTPAPAEKTAPVRPLKDKGRSPSETPKKKRTWIW
jgi:serine/threonine protein phosphatase PrpC